MPISANVQALIADLPADSPAAGSASESAAPAPPEDGVSGADPAVAPGGAPANEDPAAADRETKRSLLSEKLAEVRERRRAASLEKQARERAERAKSDSETAAAERAKWEKLRNGTFVEGMRELGRDPREVLEEMKREALEAGTPAAEIRRMQERFDGELRKVLTEQVEPLKKTIEQLQAEREEAAAREVETRFVSDFERTVKADDYRPLIVEYGEERLFDLVRGFYDRPGSIVRHAKALGVDLTHDDGRFSMREALTVLKRAQDEHEAQKQRRAQAVATPTQAGQGVPEKKPTVNGAAPATNPLGNEPASSRASANVQAPRLTRQQRVQKLIDGDGT